MGELVFVLLNLICIGFIYLIHRYYGKEQFYLLAVIYAISSFMMSFKVTKIFGLDINMGIIFSGGIIEILYYFISKYDKREIKKLLIMVIGGILSLELFLIINSLIIPSVYDSAATNYQNLVFNNLAMFIFYPIAMLATYILSSYCFVELKGEKNRKLGKTLVTIIGIAFIDTALFIYFSYAFIIDFETATNIALSNYFVKMIGWVVGIYVVYKIIGVKKVKE